MKPKISQQLTMRDAALLLGWVGPTGQPTRTDMRRLLRRLRRVEQQTSRRIVFGGGGGRCWTTINALRHAGLLDDWADMTAAIRDKVEELRELIDLLDERQRGMARSLAAQIAQLAAVSRKVGVAQVGQ